MLRDSTHTAPYRLQAAGETHQGKRDHNEDTILIRHELNLFLLADGAGGENAGNVASALATSSIAHYMEKTEAAAAERPVFDSLGLPWAARRLACAVKLSNREIIDLANSSERHRGMGTTIVAAFGEPERGVLHVAHVGDSRCYRMRDGRLEQLTQDHSLRYDVLELEPDIDEAKASGLPRNVITRALGMGESVRVSLRSFALAPGDRYLLCSDGLTNELDDEQIRDALSEPNKAAGQVKLLLDIANAAGARDNVATIVIDCRLNAGATEPRPILRPAPSPQPAPLEERDDPEIILGDEGEDDDGPELIIATEASGERAEPARIQTLIPKLASPSPIGATEREPTIPFRRGCPKCGAMFQGTQDACPNCWES